MLQTITTLANDLQQSKNTSSWLPDLDYKSNAVRYIKSQSLIKEITPIKVATSLNNSTSAIINSQVSSSIFIDFTTAYWGLDLSTLITNTTSYEDRKLSVEAVKRFSLISYVNKIYMSEDPDCFNLDIVLNTNYYSNSQLETLIDKELELRDIFNQVIINFNYLNINQELPNKDIVLIYENK